MRKTILTVLGLAVSLASVAAAQQPRGDAPRRDRGQEQRGPGGRFEGRGGPGGPRGLLLKDITLSDAQKAQLKQLHESRRETMKAGREQKREQVEQLRAARERGDTAAVRATMERNRQVMEQARAQELAAIRNILTAEQRVQFDKNVTEMKAREAERAQRFEQRKKQGGAPGFRGRRA
jgi:protein CpxP